MDVTEEPFTREYSVENFGTNYLFRVRLRLGFKVSQNVAAYLHQVMKDLQKEGTFPRQHPIYPTFDNDPTIGTIRYALIRKQLIPEAKITTSGATALRIKYAIRHVAGSPAKWFGLGAYNPLIETQPLFTSTDLVRSLDRVALRKVKRPITLQDVIATAQENEGKVKSADEIDEDARKLASRMSTSGVAPDVDTVGKPPVDSENDSSEAIF